MQPPIGPYETEEVKINLYLTTSNVALAVLEMELIFDHSKLNYVSAVGGSDFNQNFGANMLGDGKIEFGGITTKYLLGVDRHIATITFRVIAGSVGVAQFEGQVVGAADSTGNNQVVATPFLFGKVGNVGLAIGNLGGKQRRSGATTLSRRLSSVGEVRMRRSEKCTIGVGPYPVGDANGDCAFDTTDALVTAQYLEINSFGQKAIDSFFASKESTGVIRGDRKANPMDIDFNEQVMVADVQTMMYVYLALTVYDDQRYGDGVGVGDGGC